MNTLEPKAKEQADDGLLSRWAKRKQAVLQETKALQEKQEKKDLGEHERLAGSPKTEMPGAEEAALPTDKDMPPIELLNADSDFSGFMSPKVSESLRRLALRKLFHGEDFNICDGLDDYDEDYTSFVKLGSVITADMKHRLELEARKKLEEAVASGEVSDEARSETKTPESKETVSLMEDTLCTGEDELASHPAGEQVDGLADADSFADADSVDSKEVSG